jgi:hypothetical protein
MSKRGRAADDTAGCSGPSQRPGSSAADVVAPRLLLLHQVAVHG